MKTFNDTEKLSSDMEKALLQMSDILTQMLEMEKYDSTILFDAGMQLLNSLGNSSKASLLNNQYALTQLSELGKLAQNSLESDSTYFNDEHLVVNEAPIRELCVPEELVFPIGNNRVRISTSLLASIIGILISIIISLSGASSQNQEKEVQILHDILDSIEIDSPCPEQIEDFKTPEQLPHAQEI